MTTIRNFEILQHQKHIKQQKVLQDLLQLLGLHINSRHIFQPSEDEYHKNKAWVFLEYVKLNDVHVIFLKSTIILALQVVLWSIFVQISQIYVSSKKCLVNKNLINSAYRIFILCYIIGSYPFVQDLSLNLLLAIKLCNLFFKQVL